MEEWRKNNLVLFKFTVSKNTGIPDAIERAASDCGLKPNLYIRKVVEERLSEDGYLKPQDYSGPHGKLIK